MVNKETRLNYLKERYSLHFEAILYHRKKRQIKKAKDNARQARYFKALIYRVENGIKPIKKKK